MIRAAVAMRDYARAEPASGQHTSGQLTVGATPSPIRRSIEHTPCRNRGVRDVSHSFEGYRSLRLGLFAYFFG